MAVTLTPTVMAELAHEHLSPMEVIEVTQATLNHPGRYTVEINRRLAGRTLDGPEVARELLACARACARGGDA